jgi:hypothetical protein
MSGLSQFQRLPGSPGSGCGWMSTRSPLFLSKRNSSPCWNWPYAMFGSAGSTRGWKPSPPATKNQSELRTPFSLSVRDGPPQVELSCVPP